MTETTMTDALILESAGWTQSEIDALFVAYDRRRYYGYDSLTIEQRKLILRAKAVPVKVAKAKTAAKVRVTGRQPVQTKLHYRWTAFEMATLTELVETVPGEVSAFLIFKEETIRALEIYQPVLDQIDTCQRFKFIPLEGEMLEIAAELGRVANFDRDEFIGRVATEFAEDFRPAFYQSWGSSTQKYGAVIPDSEVNEFRALVRAEVEKMTRTVYPSVVAA